VAEQLIELGALHYTLLIIEQQRRQAAEALARVPVEPTIHEPLLALLDAVTSEFISEDNDSDTRSF
jgi:hypothetical protein